MIFEKIEFGKAGSFINGKSRSPTFTRLLESQKFGKTRTGQRIIFKDSSLEREKNGKSRSKRMFQLKQIAKVLGEREKSCLVKSRYVRAYTPIELSKESKNQSLSFRLTFKPGNKSFRKPKNTKQKIPNQTEDSIIGWLY